MKKMIFVELNIIAFLIVSPGCRKMLDIPEAVVATLNVKYIRPTLLVTTQPELVTLFVQEASWPYNEIVAQKALNQKSDGSFSTSISIKTDIRHRLYIIEFVSNEGNSIRVWKDILLDGQEAPLGEKVGQAEYEGYVLFKKTISGEIVFNPTGS